MTDPTNNLIYVQLGASLGALHDIAGVIRPVTLRPGSR